MILRFRHLTDLALLAVILGVQWAFYRALLQRAGTRLSRNHRLLFTASFLLFAGFITLSIATVYYRIARYFPANAVHWMQAVTLVWGLFSAGLLLVLWAWRQVPPTYLERRAFLRTMRQVSLVVPAAVTGYGTFVQRTNFHVREVDIPLPGLPRDLHGRRLVQLTDIHLSPFLSEREFARAIDMANELRGDIILVTGDLISRAGDPLDACLKQLGRLRATAGIYGCMGNHEIYAQSQSYTQREAARLGMHFLRQQNEVLQFGNAVLNIVGVDYQQMKKPYLVGAGQMVTNQPDSLNVLLSHNPDVFPVAASQGYGLTVSGHTHGGQVTVEYLHQWANVARFFTPYVDGLYQQGNAAIYVSQGIGTIGLPARIGTRPEVAVLRLCAT